MSRSISTEVKKNHLLQNNSHITAYKNKVIEDRTISNSSIALSGTQVISL